MNLEEIVATATAALAGVRHLLCGHEIAMCEEIIEDAEHNEFEDPYREAARAMESLRNQFPCEIADHLP